jgi:hypothetical protein
MPKKTLTYVDANVLINAMRGEDPIRKARSLAVLWDKRREFVATEFLRLETLPPALHYQKNKQITFLEKFFKNVSVWVDAGTLFQPAFDLMVQYDLGLVDACHLAAAMSCQAEFISVEQPTKPMFKAYTKAYSIY